MKGFGDPIDRRCVECHDNVRVTITAMGSTHCLSCHDPMANAGADIRRSAWECKKCHDKDQGDKPAIDVHSTVACSNCHRPHEEPWTMPRLCTECHVGHETFHGAAARDADGGASHAVAPHDAGTFSGEPMACATCHQPHEAGGAASGRCYECHAAKSPAKLTPAATFAGGHERCTTCHLPHGGEKAGPRPCRTCHQGVVTMDGPASEAHAKCVNCHKPHDVMGSAARRACVGCHAVHVEHPDPEGRGCTGCHEVHPGGPSRAVLATSPVATLPETAYPKAASPVTCSGCHTAAKTDLGFHAGTTPCASCHTPHAFTAASAPACSTCHARETAAAAVAAGGHGHGACKGCHQPHAPKAARPACGSCHEQEAKTTPAGHAKCTSCHDAHPTSRTPKAQCTTCHAREEEGAPRPRGLRQLPPRARPGRARRPARRREHPALPVVPHDVEAARAPRGEVARHVHGLPRGARARRAARSRDVPGLPRGQERARAHRDDVRGLPPVRKGEVGAAALTYLASLTTVPPMALAQ